jgi:hypothetical protein
LKNVDAIENFVEPTDEEDLEVRKPIIDTVDLIRDNNLINVNKGLTSDTSLADNIDILQVAGRFILETLIITDPYASSFTKVINNAEAIVNITDNGSVAISGIADPERYFEADYVNEIYTSLYVIETF